jgi:hypothetical protein
MEFIVLRLLKRYLWNFIYLCQSKELKRIKVKAPSGGVFQQLCPSHFISSLWDESSNNSVKARKGKAFRLEMEYLVESYEALEVHSNFKESRVTGSQLWLCSHVVYYRYFAKGVV